MHKASQHMQNTICTASTKKRKSHLEPSVPLCAQFETESTAKQRRPRPSRKRADFSPQPNLRLHETKTHNVSCKSEHSNRIHGAAVPMQSAKNDLQNKSELQDSTAEQVPFDQRWRNHSTKICRQWVATHNRIATHCRTHRLDEAVPIHKASQHMQNTICTASTKKRKSHLEPSVPLSAQFETDSTAKRRRPRPSRKRADFSPQPNLRLHETKTHNVSCKSEHSNRIHYAAVPTRSSQVTWKTQ